MNTFTKIIITNVTTQTIVHTLAFNSENEKAADAYARQQNLNSPRNGMLSVHYA